MPPSRRTAIWQALFVTFLWSTSWIFIKIGLQASLPAVTFAGLRYTLAFLCLFPFVLLNPAHRHTLRSLPSGKWLQLTWLGLVFYSLTQGAQFVSLAYLPAATLTLLLNFTPVVIALWSLFLKSELPVPAQWGGIALLAAGALVYFLPLALPPEQAPGLAAALVCLLANAGASLLGRRVNTQSKLSPLLITTVSMGVGGLVLLAAGITVHGLPRLDLLQVAIIAWLAFVNTAAAFTIWNHTLRTLTAVESSVINSTMLPQIALLAWLFLAEPLAPRQLLGLVLVGAGALLVQLAHPKPSPPE